ncbi:MAG TPA: hypothetical protein VG847_03545 [Chitinophagaceae bacterium]|nr:hypothetical protein [Chitinophagaceae bacterium]
MPLRATIVLIAGLLAYSQNIRAQKPEFDTTETISVNNASLNAISTRAVRHFIKHYPDVQNEKWFITSKGFVASFTSNSEIYRIYYNQKGIFRLSVIIYDGKNYPQTLERLVSIGYPGAEIKNIVELFNGSERLYGITISNQQLYRLIEYSDSDTEVVDEYNRQM